MVKPVFLTYSREHFPAVKKDLKSVTKVVESTGSIFLSPQDNTRVVKRFYPETNLKSNSIFEGVNKGVNVGVNVGVNIKRPLAVIKQGKIIDKEGKKLRQERTELYSNAVLYMA